MDEKPGLNQIRILFLGSPDFAATILQSLIASQKYDIQGVITQPDKPGKRGKKLQMPPVKQTALDNDLNVYQPADIRSEQAIETLQNLRPHALVVAAYGQIIPEQILNIPTWGALNVHASLLPKYRGAAPIQHALLNGEKATGITIMRMEPKMDTGPILLQKAMAIDINEDCQSLHDQLAELGGNLLDQALDKLQEGEITPISQDEELASYAPKLQKRDGLINWDKEARQVHNHIRAFHPLPGAFYDWNQTKLKIYPGRVGRKLQEEISPGTFLGLVEDHLRIACLDHEYLVPAVKPSSSKELTAKEFFNGYLKK